MVADNKNLYARLLGYVKPYRWAFAGSILAMAIGGAAEGSFAWFLKNMLSTLFVEGNEKYAIWAALGIVLIFFISGLSHFTSGYGMQWVGNKVILDFRNQMFQRLIRLPIPFFHQATTGTLMSKISNDVYGVQLAATTALNSMVRGGVTLVVLLGTMFYFNWKLTLIIFATVPILGFIINVFGKRIRNIGRDGLASWGALNDVLEESIRSQKVIKIFEGAAYETKRFDAVANRIRRNAMRHAVAAAASTPFTHLIVAIAIALIVYLAASPQYGTGMEISEFVAYIVSAAGLVPQIKGLSSVSEQVQRGLAAAESVFGMIDAPAEQDHGSIELERARGHLRFEAVSLQYANQSAPALSEVSLDIQPGETIALVGSSGGGKTSLVNLVPRFFLPTAGRITLDGHALDDIKLINLRRQIALVSQDVVLFNDTVSANIAYGTQGTSTPKEIEAAAIAAHCLDFIRALPQGFDTVIGENGALLSGGQRQRLAIARALIKNAPILLLDEATSALDGESERQVQSALQTLMRGRTTIVVAHRLSTIENADRIVVMGHGKILEVGSHAALSAQGGVYASLHRLQFENV